VSGVVPDAVRFCFDLVAEGTPVEGACLEIDEPAGRARCRDCTTEFAVDDLVLLCPCGSADVDLIGGQELAISSVVVARAMCGTCGCGQDDGPRYTALTGHPHGDGHPHPHEHPHTVVLEQRVLSRNDDLAARTRSELTTRGIVAINVMSSPGSGKTTLLERTIADLAPDRAIGVLEGDQETVIDAARIRAAGAPVVQINTGAGCHLDAGMVARGLAALDPPPGSLVFVENVGNLVCPALFDLGEAARVVVMSVPEGDDKPAKYPHMFRRADLVLINKTDLLPHVSFDVERCAESIRRMRPDVQVLRVSATRGDGMAEWYAWLGARSTAAAGAGSVPAATSTSPAP
jgi:hydrogenase nickel incorporation protein HypB